MFDKFYAINLYGLLRSTLLNNYSLTYTHTLSGELFTPRINFIYMQRTLNVYIIFQHCEQIRVYQTCRF